MLSRVLNITPQLWGICQKRLIETDRIADDDDNIITIKNWKKYQSEYERQKPQRTKSAEESAEESAAIEYRVKNIEYRVKNIDSNNSKKQLKNFDVFWNAYPKKKSKGQAEKEFKKVNPDDQLLQVFLKAIEEAKKSEGWLKDGGQYIPYPATWLNAKGWEDEIQKGGQSGTHREDPLPAAKAL